MPLFSWPYFGSVRQEIIVMIIKHHTYTLIRVSWAASESLLNFAFMILMIMMMIGRDFESQQAINFNKGQLYQ